MRPNVTLSVALMLVVAALAAPAIAARGHKTALDKTACTTTETETETATVLANGTRVEETHKEREVDCPGTEDDRHRESSSIDYDEDWDGSECDFEKTTVEKEYTLANGTEVDEKTVTESRDCEDDDEDFTSTTHAIRYEPAREDADDDEDDDARNTTRGKGLKVEWKEREKANASRGHAHAFGTFDNETKTELKIAWKESEKGSWLKSVLVKIRGHDADEDRTEKAEKVKAEKGGEGKRRGLAEALKHVPAGVAAKLRAIFASLQ